MKQDILKMCGAITLIGVVLTGAQLIYGKAGFHAVLFTAGFLALGALLYQVGRAISEGNARKRALKRRRGRHAKR